VVVASASRPQRLVANMIGIGGQGFSSSSSISSSSSDSRGEDDTVACHDCTP
jgi:hypothetical protein